MYCTCLGRYNVRLSGRLDRPMVFHRLHTSSCCTLLFFTGFCLGKKELWNDQVDILLEYFSIGYKASNSSDIPIMDIKNKTTSISGLRLGDITTIKRLSDTVMEALPNGDTRFSGVFGLDKFELKITAARVNGYNGPAIVSSKNNSADITYTIVNPERAHSCKTLWERFKLGEFSEVKVITPETYHTTTQPDRTEEFNKRILPTLNHYFNTPEFLATLSRTFDICTLKQYAFPL